MRQLESRTRLDFEQPNPVTAGATGAHACLPLHLWSAEAELPLRTEHIRMQIRDPAAAAYRELQISNGRGDVRGHVLPKECGISFNQVGG
jgi:hypothetical protein